MKKILLFFLFITSATYSQKQPSLENKSAPVSLKTISDRTAHTPALYTASTKSNHKTAWVSMQEEKIGYTYYDLQTNASSINGLIKNNDGSYGAVWTFSPDALTNFPNRGTGYNYFDGTTEWYFTPPQLGHGGGAGGDFPQVRIDGSNRTGFPAICVTASGVEVVLQSTGSEMSMNRRTTKGSGPWQFSTPFGTFNNDSWPKVTCGGANGETIHAIWTGNSPSHGQNAPIFYSRSTDGGLTWGISRSIIHEIDSNYYYGFGPQSYSIDCKGNTVVIAFGHIYSDLGLLKSTDGGLTWTKTIIDTFPIPFYYNSMLTDTNNDGVADTVNTHASDPNVLIDNFGICHLWYSFMQIYNGGLFTQTDGLLYWNETMPANGSKLIAQSMDLNGNGMIDFPAHNACYFTYADYNCGLTGMPSAGVDAFNRLFVAYQSINELTDTSLHFVHKHIYIITSTNIGNTWSDPVDIVPDSNTLIAPGVAGNGEYQEAIFPCMAKKVDQYVYIMYQRDSFPGTALTFNSCLSSLNNGRQSDIIFTRVEVSSLINSTGSLQENINVDLYPNPATSNIQVTYSLPNYMEATLEITDLMGKIISKVPLHSTSRSNPEVNLNCSNWARGIYFYRVVTKDAQRSGRIVIQ